MRLRRFCSVAQKVDDLRLDQHVERAGRLVEHHEGGLQHDGAGDRDALALAAGEFMRIAKARLRIEPDVAQRPDHARLALAPWSAWGDAPTGLPR